MSSFINTVSAVAGPSIAFTLLTAGWNLTTDFFTKTYGTTMELPVEQQMGPDGRLYTPIGFTGHSKDTFDKGLDFEKGVYATDKYTEAADYAYLNSKEGKPVVGVLASAGKCQIGMQRFENQHAPYYPTKEGDFIILAQIELDSENDPRFGTCFKRAISSISSPNSTNSTAFSTNLIDSKFTNCHFTS